MKHWMDFSLESWTLNEIHANKSKCKKPLLASLRYAGAQTVKFILRNSFIRRMTIEFL